MPKKTANFDSKAIILKIVDFPENLKLLVHGLYVNGNHLFAINHAYEKGGERVEKFEVNLQEKSIKYIASMRLGMENLALFNDLIVLDDNDTIIMTNWLLFPHTEKGPSKIKALISMFVSLGFQSSRTLVYSCSFKAEKCIPIEGTQAIMNNGITWDRKGHVFIVDTMKRKIREFSLEYKNKNSRDYREVVLKKVDEYITPYYIDNITFNQSEDKIDISYIRSFMEYLNLVQYVEEHCKYPTFNSKNPEKNELIYYTGAGELLLSNRRSK